MSNIWKCHHQIVPPTFSFFFFFLKSSSLRLKDWWNFNPIKTNHLLYITEPFPNYSTSFVFGFMTTCGQQSKLKIQDLTYYHRLLCTLFCCQILSCHKQFFADLIENDEMYPLYRIESSKPNGWCLTCGVWRFTW